MLMRKLPAFFLFLVCATAAPAQMREGVELVKADLLANVDAIVPGKPFTVGLRRIWPAITVRLRHSGRPQPSGGAP